MGLLQPYVGRFVTAESATNKIDAEAIIAGCDAVDAEAEEITNIGAKVDNAGSLITPNALSFDNVTVDENLGQCCSGIEGVYGNILGTTSQIRSLATDVYNKFQTQYNEEAKIKDKAAIADYEKKRSSNNE